MSSSRHNSPKYSSRRSSPKEDNNGRNPQQGNSPGPSSSPRYGHFVPPNTDHYPIPVTLPNAVAPNHYPVQGHFTPQGQFPVQGFEQHHHGVHPSSSYTPAHQPYPVQHLQVSPVAYPYPPVVPQTQGPARYNVPGPSHYVSGPSSHLPGPSNHAAGHLSHAFPGPSTSHAVPQNMIPQSNKPYMCSHCHQTFSRPDAFERHAKSNIHKADRAFKCSLCGMELTRDDSLARHMAKKHSDPKTDKPKPQ